MKTFLIWAALISVTLGQAPSTQPAQPQVLNFGWSPPTAEERALAQDNVYTQQLRELVKYNDDSDVLLYRFLYRALEESNQLTEEEKQTGRLESLNQLNFGHCVGMATARALDITAACDIYIRNEAESWKVEFAPHAMYAVTRQDNRGTFDGSCGSWMAETLNKYGTLHRLSYGQQDLVNLGGDTARQWASKGVPVELLEIAKEHKAISCALVTDIDSAKAALQNGYAINLCANVGYNNTRDEAGFLRRASGWSHSMCCCGWRNQASGKEGFLILQSWGGNWASGNIYPEDMPSGAFWISVQDMKAHLSSGDCYAVAGYNGFKRRNLKWEELFKIGEEINGEDN